MNDFAQTYFNIYYAPLRTCSLPQAQSESSRSDSSLSGPDHVQIQRRPLGRVGLQASRATFDRYSGSVDAWIKDITSVNPTSVTQPCWHRLPDASLPSCDGDCSYTQPVIAIPIALLIEFPETDGGDWFIPDRITIARRNKNLSEAIVYELTSRVFFKSEVQHYALRFRTKPASGNRYNIYDYDDMDNGGYAQRILAGSMRSHMVGQHADIVPPPGFTSTAAAIFVLSHGTTAQQMFSSRQASALQATHGISLSSSDVPTIPSAVISFESEGLSLVADHDRYWFKKARRKTAEYLDFARDVSAEALPSRTAEDTIAVSVRFILCYLDHSIIKSSSDLCPLLVYDRHPMNIPLCSITLTIHYLLFHSHFSADAERRVMVMMTGFSPALRQFNALHANSGLTSHVRHPVPCHSTMDPSNAMNANYLTYILLSCGELCSISCITFPAISQHINDQGSKAGQGAFINAKTSV